MNKILVVCIVYSILLIVGIYTYLFLMNNNEIDIDQGKAILNKIENETLEEQVLSPDEHTEEEHIHDESDYGHDEQLVKIFRDIESTLSFFGAALKDEHERSFTSMFTPEQYSKDLWTYSDDPYTDL